MKPFLKIFLVIIVFFVLFFVFFYLLNLHPQKSVNPPQHVAEKNLLDSVCIKNNCFSVELAITEAQRERGLMFRTQLDENKGMLFIFGSDGIYPFWMKNTLIPLDIIWIDKNGKVVFIGDSIQPCKTAICQVVTPLSPAKYVLEINAGLCEKYKIKTGDIADFKIEN